jgi:hypothetical protein
MDVRSVLLLKLPLESKFSGTLRPVDRQRFTDVSEQRTATAGRT